jgi:adenylate cyclase
MGESTQEPTPPPRPPWLEHVHRIKGWVVAVAGVGAVLSGLVGYYTTYRTVASGTPAPRQAARPTAGPLSILVLPFANQTGDAQKAYVADALTATVTTDLSRLSEAYVVPTATALAFRDRSLTVQQVGAEAGVRFVLQGNVLSAGQKVRLAAQLSDTHSGALVWSDTVDGDVTDLFALQDRITTGIGNSVRREMLVRAARESEMRKSSPAVADLTLRARALMLKPRSVENYAAIEALLRQALALEPDNLSIMASLAATLATAADNFGRAMGDGPREAKFAEARQMAVKGIASDPERGANHAVLAMYSRAHQDHAGALRAGQRNLALSPKSPQAHNLLAAILNDTREDPRAALDLCNEGIALDPLHASEWLFANQGWAYLQLGDYEQAISAFNRSLEQNPAIANTRIALVLAHSLKGDDAKARALAADVLRDVPALTSERLLRSRFMTVGTPQPSKDDFDSKLLAAWRRAGLPG